jgi:hypothetical protein
MKSFHPDELVVAVAGRCTGHNPLLCCVHGLTAPSVVLHFHLALAACGVRA